MGRSLVVQKMIEREIVEEFLGGRWPEDVVRDLFIQ